MSPRNGLSRLEPAALAVALAAPLPMLALLPDGLGLLQTVLVLAVAAAALYGLYRLAVRGRPHVARGPALVPPPLGPAPEAIRAAPFRVRRGDAPVLDGSFEDLVAAAAAGRLRANDLVEGGGVQAAPADLLELLPHVASRAESRARRAYLVYLAAALGAGAAGIAVLAAARLAGHGAGEGSPLLVFLFAAALVPLLSLRREWRRLEEGRSRGLVPAPPLPRTFGSASLDAALAGPTPATRRVLVLVVAVSALALVLPPEVLQLRLAKDNEAIRAGEVWRLLTAGLVHGGAFHLFMNGAVLANLGGFVERLLGARRMLLVLWGGVLAGSLASFATNPNRSVGISGGLFALVGTLLAVGLRHRRALPAPARRMLVRAPIEIIVLNLALGLAIPIIDNAAHLGGLAAGFLLGLVLGVHPTVGATLRAPADGDAPRP
jgi:membrane associated rhomboid family serine protease